jgi:hypothetical protein
MFLSALYCIPQRLLVLHSQDHMETRFTNSCEGVHHRVAKHTKTWGLPFPFLITHILRKKGIKGNAMDGPITESPHFGHIQWN